MRGRRRQRLDQLAGAADQRQRRPQLRGHVGAEAGGDPVQVVDLARGEPQDRGGVAAAAPQPGRDRHPLLDLDPQRTFAPAASRSAASALAARFSPSTPGQMTSSRSASETSIRSASASGSNSEQSSCRPSPRRAPR